MTEISINFTCWYGANWKKTKWNLDLIFVEVFFYFDIDQFVRMLKSTWIVKNDNWTEKTKTFEVSIWTRRKTNVKHEQKSSKFIQIFGVVKIDLIGKFWCEFSPTETEKQKTFVDLQKKSETNFCFWSNQNPMWVEKEKYSPVDFQSKFSSKNELKTSNQFDVTLLLSTDISRRNLTGEFVESNSSSLFWKSLNFRLKKNVRREKWTFRNFYFTSWCIQIKTRVTSSCFRIESRLLFSTCFLFVFVNFDDTCGFDLTRRCSRTS